MMNRRQLLTHAVPLGLAAHAPPALAATAVQAVGRPDAADDSLLGVWRGDSFRGSVSAYRGAGLATGTPKRRDLVVGFGVSKERRDQKEWDRYLTLFDINEGAPHHWRVRLSHFAHGILQHPNQQNHVVALQKRGPGASVVDIAKGEVLQPIVTVPGRQFYGHGAFSPDGSFLYTTETEIANGYKGLLVVRDSKTYEALGEIETFGESPHDCRLLDGGRVLAVTNGGGPISGAGKPSVTFVDLMNGKLLERLEFEREEMNAGHLAMSSRGDLVVVSSFRDGLESKPGARGGISLRHGGVLRTLTEPASLMAEMVGETLSVAIDETRNVFATTTPEGNVLAFWDLETGALRYAEYLPQPKGVLLTRDNTHYVVSYTTLDGRALISRWSADTLRRVPEYDLMDTYVSGSHLVRFTTTV